MSLLVCLFAFCAAARATALPVSEDVSQRERAGDNSAMGLRSAYLDRSYYTSEREAVVICDFDLPAAMLKGKRVVVKGPDGGVIGSTNRASGETRVRMDIHDLPCGTHKLSAELQEGSGEVAFSRPLDLIKRQPRPGFEWKTDRINRRVLRDGKPFLCICLMIGSRHPGQEFLIKESAQLGVNCVGSWPYP